VPLPDPFEPELTLEHGESKFIVDQWAVVIDQIVGENTFKINPRHPGAKLIADVRRSLTTFPTVEQSIEASVQAAGAVSWILPLLKLFGSTDGAINLANFAGPEYADHLRARIRTPVDVLSVFSELWIASQFRKHGATIVPFLDPGRPDFTAKLLDGTNLIVECKLAVNVPTLSSIEHAIKKASQQIKGVGADGPGIVVIDASRFVSKMHFLSDGTPLAAQPWVNWIERRLHSRHYRAISAVVLVWSGLKIKRFLGTYEAFYAQLRGIHIIRHPAPFHPLPAGLDRFLKFGETHITNATGPQRFGSFVPQRGSYSPSGKRYGPVSYE
jgi:hypothetical protein